MMMKSVIDGTKTAIVCSAFQSPVSTHVKHLSRRRVMIIMMMEASGCHKEESSDTLLQKEGRLRCQTYNELMH